MQHVGAEALGLDIEEVNDRLRSGVSLPSHCYVDQNVFEFELRAIFDRSWMYFAPVEKFTEPGTVMTGHIGRTPVIVTRADDGELRGFVNVCRHRGFTLVPEDRQCSRIQCGYHSWTYGLDGALLRTPRTDDIGIDKEELGLQPVSIEEWGQGVYVNPDPDASPLRGAHPRLDEMATSTGLWMGVDDFRWAGRYVHNQAANWKLWYDNGTECYHCPTIHKSSFGSAYDVSDGSFRLGTWGSMYSGEFDPVPAANGELVGGSYRSLQLFPCNQLVQQDGFVVLGRAVPNGPGSTTFIVDYFSEQDTPTDRIEEWVKLWNQTYEEDARVVEEIQSNLASGRVDAMRYIPGLEDASRFMHGLIWDAYRAAL